MSKHVFFVTCPKGVEYLLADELESFGLAQVRNAPAGVWVEGTLESGAVVSAHVASVPWHGSGHRMEVYGREGTLVLSSAESASLGAVSLQGGRGQAAGLEEILNSVIGYFRENSSAQ